MGTISATKITAALKKAREVGVVEESLTIEDVALVMRNLRPDQYSAVYVENNEKEGMDHLFSFQKSHICRSIIEINGVDLRDVDYIEVEEEVKDPKTGESVLDTSTGQPKIKKIKLERHEYVRKHVLDGWTKEPLQIAWRKFGDVLKLAEDKAKEGVKFILPEQTPEEKFREAVGNLRETIDEVPSSLVDSILEEAGLIRISTAAEVQKAFEKADQLARDMEATNQTAPQQPSAQQVSPPQPPVTDPRVRQPTPQEVQDMMARRTPLNREAVSIPSPNVQPTMAQAAPQPPPRNNLPPVPQVAGADQVKTAQRAQKIAQLEADSLDMEVPLPPPGDPTMTPRHITAGAASFPGLPNAPHLQKAPSEVGAVLQKGHDKVDMQAFDKTVNQPPAAGINPRYRPAR